MSDKLLLTLLSWLALAGLTFCLAVPAPPPRPPKPTGITAGSYTLTWGGSEYTYTLSRDGTTHGICGPDIWVGHWTYDPSKRLLTITEWRQYEPWDLLTWTVVLDEKLMGRADWRETQTWVWLTRRGK